MTKCDSCGQELPEPCYLDALGRELNICNVLLYLQPVRKVTADGLTVQSDVPIAYEPIVLLQTRTEAALSFGVYEIQATELLPGNEVFHSSRTYDIAGEVGKPNPLIYKIADNMEDLPL